MTRERERGKKKEVVVMLLPEGFQHVGNGWLSVDANTVQQLRVQQDLAEIYDIEESWFAK